MKSTFKDLVDITEKLRAPDGCPWDREQTIESLKPYVIEEAYETVGAADEGGMKLADELGDLLLQITMMAQIGKEQGTFDIDDVTDCICKKMIRRHPHVFGDVSVETSQEVLKNWDKIKQGERGDKSHTDELKSVTAALPALMRAQKVQSKAAKSGFDFASVSDAAEKLREETNEILEAIKNGSEKNIIEEAGDLLFAAVNVVRLAKVNAETACSGATDKFIRRFETSENLAKKDGKKLENMSADELDKLWNAAKTGESSGF